MLLFKLAPDSGLCNFLLFFLALGILEHIPVSGGHLNEQLGCIAKGAIAIRIRVVAAAVHPTPKQDSPERALAVRQPRSHADELASRSC